MTWAWSEEDRRPGSARLADYTICQGRGHQASGLVLSSNPPWETCKHCGTAYRYERVLKELNRPGDHDLTATLEGMYKALSLVLRGEPQPNGQYLHLVECNGDRRKPPGTWGITCCCKPSGGKVGAPASAESDEAAPE